MFEQPPYSREELHHRKIECRGYHRYDGKFDIEAWLTDFKGYPMPLADGERIVPVGQPLHSMGLRITIDADSKIHTCESVMAASPYAVCRGALRIMPDLVGLTISGGFLKAASERLTRQESCTHLVQLLGPLATTAYQTLSVIRQSAAAGPVSSKAG